MINKEYFTRRSVEFLLKFWRECQNAYINLRGEMNISSNIRECLPLPPHNGGGGMAHPLMTLNDLH